MANRYLLPIYKMLYDKEFSYADFEQRMEMQKGIYLLQDMGVPVGDYGFRWYLHGPYSQDLQDDMYYEDGKPMTELSLSSENADSIKQLHNIINSRERGDYSVSKWVECLASLHYLRENMLSPASSESEVISELERRKSHLNNHRVNIAAYKLVKGLC